MEKKVITYKSFLKKVAAATDCNDHNGARILIAIRFGFTKQLQELQDIREKSDKIGFMPYELITERTDITARMMERIEKNNGIEIMQEVYSNL